MSENCPKCGEYYGYNSAKKHCSECGIIDSMTGAGSHYAENCCPKCGAYYGYNRPKRHCSECGYV